MLDKKIIIDLNQTDTKAFDDPIQSNATKNFDKLIQDFLKTIEERNKVEADTPQCQIDRVHNTILINGKRGMGKTSFILSIQKDKYILKDIANLCIIDPTLIETKEHVFLNIITLIKNKVDESIQCNRCDYNDAKYKNWKESLKKLASGLSMLDGIGSDHLKDGMWDSPELILERGLSNSKQGVDLEKNFHKYIDESLVIINKKAFFLILDDIDTSLDKGTAILETLRKYLTSRKLIIAMLGDMSLYSTLVRQLQWEKMDPKKILKDYELENKNTFISQIEHLEEQYLTKILKPENRIDLENLLTLKSKLAINTAHNEFTIVVKNMIEQIYLTKNSGYTTEYEYTLLTQSTRSVLQILQAWNEKEGLAINFIVRFKHTFYTTLKKKLEPYNLIELPQKEKFLKLLSIYILNQNITRDNHLISTPTFAKEEDNIAMLYLNMIANHLLEPRDYLSYFIKIGYVLEVYKTFLMKDYTLEKFVDEIVVNDNIPASSIAEKLLYAFDIAPNNLREGDKHFGNLFIKSVDVNKIENNEANKLLCEVYYPKLGTINFFSFFKFLGYIADISANTISVNDLDEDMIQWQKKATDMPKLPLFILSKIWTRLAKTFVTIEERSENRNKSFLDTFELYVAGFLNAVYVEIELYHQRKVDVKNVSTSRGTFYEKLTKNDEYKNKGDEYSFLKYLLDCPLLNSNNSYLSSIFKDEVFMRKVHIKDINSFSFPKMDLNQLLEERHVRKRIIEKTDFSKLSTEEQKDIIKSINGWNNYASQTIANELRYKVQPKYRNVKIDLINQLLHEMKS